MIRLGIGRQNLDQLGEQFAIEALALRDAGNRDAAVRAAFNALICFGTEMELQRRADRYEARLPRQRELPL